VAVLFSAMHIPSHLAQPSDAPWWTLIPLIPGLQPTGLIWGYLCYRTRSIWPGVLWHTSFMTLGVLFLG
jgi:membrane protease YdiL (CAAX protease family)